MAVLVVGLIIFLGLHSLRIVLPSARERMIERLGEGPFKGVYSVISLIGFALIIWGFGLARAETGVVYETAGSGLRHATEALMLPALILAVASALPPGYIRRVARHPLLIGTILWASAHLLVNGETAAVVLFGAFLVWAVVDLAAQAGRSRQPGPKPSPAYDIAAVLVGAVLYAALVWRVHEWAFGVSPLA
ncbi:MAG: NnrU family protein [Bauldia sp.]|nr:NnrU family protein [Bauldia sp.]